MKTFLKFDYYFQCTLLFFFILGILWIPFGGAMVFLSFFSFMLLAFWQPLSAIIHSAATSPSGRDNYLAIVPIYLIGFVFTSQSSFEILSWGYFLFSLVIAIWYFNITRRDYEEQNIVRSFWDLEA